MSEETKMTFEEYKEDWLTKHPASIPVEEAEDSPYPKWAGLAAFAAFVTSALLSGVHMMPAVYAAIPLSPITDEIMRQWVARGSFVAYELGMFMAAFLMNVPATKKLAQMLSTIIFVTLIAVNLYSVLTVYGFDLQNNLAGAAVSVMFSLVPAIAYGSGKFYINIGIAERAVKKRGKDTLQDKSKKMDATILKDFAKYEKEWREAHIQPVQPVHEARSVNSLNEQAMGSIHPVNSANGYTKQMNSRQIIQSYFEQHPEFRNMTLDQLNEAIERETGVRVGRTSIHNVRKEWEIPVHSNGHSKEEIPNG